ncbi:MAG TPA: hypothetical protein PKM73_07580 [Verrucomicrobiota bacterium]|nr:hypothetical protein [Verrucomicrobiota bacterium]HNU51252.1 hypothetical protein [Verrucomicrobiota bacterium]
MKYIDVHRDGDRCRLPDGKLFQIVVAEGIDAEGDWIPSRVESFRTDEEFVEGLKKYLGTGDGVVIRAPAGFNGLATRLGLPLLRGEWGLL